MKKLQVEKGNGPGNGQMNAQMGNPEQMMNQATAMLRMQSLVMSTSVFHGTGAKAQDIVDLARDLQSYLNNG